MKVMRFLWLVASQIHDILLRKQATIFILLFVKESVASYKAYSDISDSRVKVQ